MPKPISTRTHGILDFLTAGAMLTIPRVFDCSRELRNAVTAIAVQKIGYALMTRHEFGVARVIPMPVHLVLDSVGGAALAALPLILDEQDEGATAACVGMGLFDIAAAPMTETEAPFDLARKAFPRREENPAALPFASVSA